MNGIQLEWILIKRFELYNFKNFDWEKNIVILNIGILAFNLALELTFSALSFR